MLTGTLEVYVADAGRTEMPEVRFWLDLIEKHTERMAEGVHQVMREVVERVGLAQRQRQ